MSKLAKGKSITQQLVAETAIAMARRDGIDSVTYNQLARELGIRPQSLYRYVKNIREVRVIILRAFLNEMIDFLRESLAGKDPKEALYIFSTQLYDFNRQNPSCNESLELLHKYDVLNDLQEQLNSLTSLVQTPIEALKPQEAARYTQLFMAVTIGYTHMGLAHSSPPGLQYDRNSYLKSMKEFIDALF